MTDEILTTESSETAEQATASSEPTPTPETQPAQNADAGKMFTQDELNKLIKERLDRERAKQTKAASKAKADAEKKALEEQKKFQELYETEKAEREKLARDMEALRIQGLRRDIAAKHNVPSGLIARIQGSTEEEIEADVKLLIQALPTQRPPSLDSKAGGGTGSNTPTLTDAEIREQAARLNVSFDAMKTYLSQ